MPRTPTLTTLTVLLAFQGWQWMEHTSLEEHQQQQQKELEATRRELQRMSRALGEQRAQLERLTRDVALTPTPTPGQTPAFPAGPPASNAGVERPAPPAPPEHPVPPSAQEMVASLEEAVHVEPIDPHWSRQAEDLARAKLERVLTTSRLESVHCGASLCRVETSHPSQEALEQFREQVLMAPEPVLWNGATYSSVQGDALSGTLVTVSYVAREGRPLPSLEHR